MLKAKIDSDLKKAMLEQDKPLVSVLRYLKSAILYREVEDGKRDEGLDDLAIIDVLKKEKKSRQDAFDLYVKADDEARVNEEKYQMSIIEKYLPEELPEPDTRTLVNNIISELGLESVTMKDMGIVMKAVRAKNPNTNGSIVSAIIKEKQS